MVALDNGRFLPLDRRTLQALDRMPGTTLVRFQVPGIPISQGSKNPWGGETSKQLKPWRATIALIAREAMHELGPFRGAVGIECDFLFPRPKHHFGTGRNAGKLKSNTPLDVTRKPDLDKLQRALFDALTGICYVDDAQVARVNATKMYSEHPGVRVTLWQM